ncbi:hypothetical protein OS493_040116 [Desmophyllum pertusum]|uniref:Uncharacterized protein n=1 Tax=Desmophyllum pertusum TaxID=174260 RepID=A0A9X0CVA7_9CNID|nr:hypothetical protein OS493_040116 [Desmophyllum pertusum]
MTSHIGGMAHSWYGSDKETHARVRSFAYGKLKVDDDGLLPVDPKSNIDITGFSKNWWIGLSILHKLIHTRAQLNLRHVGEESS